MYTRTATRHVAYTRQARQPARPAATTPPTPPRSGKHRRRMVKAAIARLSRLSGFPCRILARASPAQLLAVVAGIPAGRQNRQGKARRLVAKLLRLAA